MIRFTAADIDQIVARIRGGLEVTVNRGSHRGHTSYRGEADGFVLSEYDDGSGSERACTEEDVRAAIFQDPGEFVDVLRAPLRDALSQALLTGGDARAALDALLVYGDTMTGRELLEAFIDRKPSPAAIERAQIADGSDVYRAIRAGIGPETKSVAAGELGLRFHDSFVAMFGREVPNWDRYDTQFREMTVDCDLMEAIARSPTDDTPRLVLADALSERGDPRGEFIIAQCTVAKSEPDDPIRASLEPRIMQLVALHGQEWGKRRQIFERGFVNSAEVRWMAFQKEADELFAMMPALRELRFRNVPNDQMDRPSRVLDDPRLDRLPALDFSDPVFRVEERVDRELLSNARDFGAEVIAKIEGRFPTLESLTLRNTIGFSSLAAIGARSSLKQLDLGFCPLTGLLEPLRDLKALRVLNLPRCGLVGTDAIFLRELSLERLDLAGNPIGDEGAKAARDIAGLVALDLSDTKLGPKGVAALVNLPLHSLDIEKNDLDDDAIRALVGGHVASTLRRLRIGSIKTRSAPYVAHLMKGMPHLWEIDLRGFEINADGAIALLEALPSLRYLRLPQCNIDDNGLARLVAHPRFGQLELLQLDHNLLGPNAGAVLAGAPRLPLCLLLRGNRLGDTSARALAEAAVSARVTELNLEVCSITDEGAAALVAESSHLRALASLSLGFNLVTDVGSQTCYNVLGKRLSWSSS